MTTGPLGGAVQQRVRPAQPARLFPRLRTAWTAPRGAATTKPIMIAGGIGNIGRRRRRSNFRPAPLLVQLGGQACASAWAAARPVPWPRPTTPPRRWTSTRCSAATRRSSAARREVINHRWALGGQPHPGHPRRRRGRPQQRLPELVHGGRRGAFDLRKVPLEGTGLAPEGNLVQREPERYVLAIAPDALPQFEGVCRARALPVCRGRHGHRRAALVLRLSSAADDGPPIDMPMEVLLGSRPHAPHWCVRGRRGTPPRSLTRRRGLDRSVALRVLRHPTGQTRFGSPSATARSAA